MRVYLTFLLLLALACSYRFSSKRNIPLTTMPDDIFFLESDVLVTQIGSAITIWNATTDTPIQNFTADSSNPRIQISPETKKVLFRNNKSIYQLQEAKEPESLEVPTDEVFWVYKLGTVDNHTIMHTTSNINGGRTVYYVNIYDEAEYKNWSDKVSGENVVAGSGVSTLSKDEYYFVSGGVCGVTGANDVFMLYQGDSTGIENVYNFTVPGCNYPEDEDHKEEWDLSTVDIGQGDRWHAFSYVLDRERGPRWFTTQVIAWTNGVPAEVLRFDTSRLIGVEFLNKVLYTAEEELCRITEHRFENYLNATTEDSYLPAEVSETVLSFDEQWLVGLTGTGRAYLLARLNDSYVLEQTIDAPGELVLAEAYFSNNTLVVFKDNLANLHIWDAVNKKLSSATTGSVNDYCVTDGSMVYTFTNDASLTYTLHVLRVEADGTDLNLVEQGSRVLGYPTSDLLCINTRQVLVNPLNFGDPIRMWSFNSTFTNTASLIKLPTLHDKVFKTKSYIFFTNTDQRTTPIFYNYNLAPIGINGFIMMAPDTVYRMLRTASDFLVVAVGDDLTNLAGLDSYELVGTSIIYRGSFSLLNNRQAADVGRVVVLPATSRIHIDDSAAPYQVHDYNMQMPPQYLRGMFFDATQLDCSGYSDALFRVNNVTNKTEMIAINGLEATPVLERFEFTGNTAQLVSTAYMDNYLYTKLSIELSEDGQNVLVYGIKRTSTLVNCIQIRSATNLGDVTFEKIYHEEMDDSDIQAFGLIRNNVFAAVVNTDSNITEEHYIKLLNQPNSGGKVSTGEVGEVLTFSSCTSCNFIAVVGSNDRTKILLTDVNTGVLIRTVDAQCEVAYDGFRQKISLNADGTLIGYLCSNSLLKVYQTQTGIYHSKTSPESAVNIRSVKALSASRILINTDTGLQVVDLGVAQDLTQKTISSLRAPVVEYNQQTYVQSLAYEVNFYNFQGQLTDTFPMPEGEQLEALTFAPNSDLVILTTALNLIMVTPEPCYLNYTQTLGYCICDPSFDTSGEGCQCSPEHYYEDLECKCSQGKYYVSNTHCGECSAFCSTCTTGDGIGDCDSYGAGFFIMIIGICLAVIVAVVIIIVVVMRKKKAGKGRHSSEFAGQAEEKLVDDDDKD